MAEPGLAESRLAEPGRGRPTLVLLHGIGGNAAGTAEIFDPVANTFTALPCHLSEPRSFHAAIRLRDGSILVAGGLDREGTTLRSAEILHPDTLECERIGTMFAPRAHFTMRMLPDGKVQAIGALIGPIMKATRGQADAGRVREIIMEKLGVS